MSAKKLPKKRGTGILPMRSTGILPVVNIPGQGRDGPGTHGQDARATSPAKSKRACILVTGFEPFDNSPDNPSADVIAELARKPPKGVRLATGLLPVSARRAPRILLRLLVKHQPAAMLLLGEARGAPCIRVERLAANLLYADIPDNDGAVLKDEPIVPDGPAAYWTTWPHRQMLDAVRQAGIPCVYSFSAGTYLCNQMLYLALHWCQANSPHTRVGFAHLPSLPRQMASVAAPKPTMDLGTSVQAVRALLATVKGSLK